MCGYSASAWPKKSGDALLPETASPPGHRIARRIVVVVNAGAALCPLASIGTNTTTFLEPAPTLE